MAARSSWGLVQAGRFGVAGFRATGRRRAAVALGAGVRFGETIAADMIAVPIGLVDEPVGEADNVNASGETVTSEL